MTREWHSEGASMQYWDLVGWIDVFRDEKVILQQISAYSAELFQLCLVSMTFTTDSGFHGKYICYHKNFGAHGKLTLHLGQFCRMFEQACHAVQIKVWRWNSEDILSTGINTALIWWAISNCVTREICMNSNLHPIITKISWIYLNLLLYQEFTIFVSNKSNLLWFLYLLQYYKKRNFVILPILSNDGVISVSENSMLI